MKRLVARSMTCRNSPAIERATSPFQHAMTNRASYESVVHILQGLTVHWKPPTASPPEGVDVSQLSSTTRSSPLQQGSGLRDQDALRNHCGIQVHVGKTKIWNQAGNRRVICDALERMAQQVDHLTKSTVVLRGDIVTSDSRSSAEFT